MSGAHNPMLLNAANFGQPTVQPLQALTKAYTPRFSETYKYYACTVLNHHMHRPDGKKLGFVHGFYRTNDVHDHNYLDEEIGNGNPFIRMATDDEIHTYNMRVDPRGTMAAELRPAMEEEIKFKLQAELEKALQQRLTSIGVVLTDEQLAAFKAGSKSDEADNQTILDLDSAKLGTLDRLKDRAGIKSGSGTVMMGAATPVLQGIVGTDRLPNAAGSIKQ